MKRVTSAMAIILASSVAFASQTEPPVVYDNSTGQVSIWANDKNSQIGTLSNGVFVPSNVDPGTNISAIKKQVNSLASNTIYSTGTVTNSTNAYTAPAGAQPCPTALLAGQVYFALFNVANTGAPSLAACGFSAKAVKLQNSAGSVYAMVGGEIVPGPAFHLL